MASMGWPMSTKSEFIALSFSCTEKNASKKLAVGLVRPRLFNVPAPKFLCAKFPDGNSCAHKHGCIINYLRRLKKTKHPYFVRWLHLQISSLRGILCPSSTAFPNTLGVYITQCAINSGPEYTSCQLEYQVYHSKKGTVKKTEQVIQKYIGSITTETSNR